MAAKRNNRAAHRNERDAERDTFHAERNAESAEHRVERNKTDAFLKYHCFNSLASNRLLAQSMLQALIDGKEMIPDVTEGNWPNEFSGDDAASKIAREIACDQLQLAYSDDLSCRSMQVCRAIFCELHSRANQTVVTIDEMRQLKRLVKIPEIGNMQLQITSMQNQITGMQNQITGMQNQITGIKDELTQFRLESQQRFDQSQQRFDQSQHRFDQSQQQFDQIMQLLQHLGSNTN